MIDALPSVILSYWVKSMSGRPPAPGVAAFRRGVKREKERRETRPNTGNSRNLTVRPLRNKAKEIKVNKMLGLRTHK